MEATIKHDVSEHNVPFCELKLSPADPRDGVYFITFRKYPKRVFVATEDYRGDWSSGADLDDCWTAPSYIIEKTYVEKFSPFDAFKKAMIFLGEWDTSIERFSKNDYWVDAWQEIYPVVKKWSQMSYRP